MEINIEDFMNKMKFYKSVNAVVVLFEATNNYQSVKLKEGENFNEQE